MGLLHDIRCRLGWHDYGEIEGDSRGAHVICTYCNHVKQLDSHRPPEAHDHLNF